MPLPTLKKSHGNHHDLHLPTGTFGGTVETIETMKNPSYSLELFMRVITVSLETMKIVGWLPGVEIGL